MPAKAPCVEVAEEVAAQAKVGAVGQAGVGASREQNGKLPRALNDRSETAAEAASKRKAVMRDWRRAKKSAARADQACRPDRSGQERRSHDGSAVSQKAGKTFGQQDSGEQDRGREGFAEAGAGAKRTRVALTLAR